MTYRTPAAIATDIFEAVARCDADAVVSHFAEGIHDDYVAIQVFQGREAARAFFKETFEAFSDFTMQVIRILADDTTAAVQWRVTGTFTGSPFQGIRATGRPVDLKGCDIMEFADGKLARNTVYYDGATFARQIGLLPPVDSRADSAVVASFNAVTRTRQALTTLAGRVRS